MSKQLLQFDVDKERNITIALAEFLDRNGWRVVACHPPGGHTSFSILNGRRSKGGYMPDVVAIKFDKNINDFIVIIAESKPNFQKTNKDIQKLFKLSDIHAQWIAFRLQKSIDSKNWLSNWRTKLQKIIAFEEGDNYEKFIPEEVIAFQFICGKEPKIVIGEKAPARNILLSY
jgi:hypothetical protein